MLRLAIVFFMCMHAPVYGNETSCDELDAAEAQTERADREVDAVYETVLDSAGDSGKPLLEAAQSAWRLYRQAHCEAIEETIAFSFTECAAFMAHERALELRNLGRLALSKAAD